MGCVQVTWMRLTNCFCVIWGKLNYFETGLMVLSQEVARSRRQRTSAQDAKLEYFDEGKQNGD